MNYNPVARYYDKLSRLVFGNNLLEAQSYFLDRIPPGSKVLIVGGGTGQILEEITRLQPSGLHITYIDSSTKMTDIARCKNITNNKVIFITAPVETTNFEYTFDVIITPFLFDNFKPDSAAKIFSAIDRYLAKDGLWLYTDFRNTKALRQKLLLKIMYAFFRLFCGIEATQLPDIKNCFENSGYAVVMGNTFMKGFIASTVYKRY